MNKASIMCALQLTQATSVRAATGAEEGRVRSTWAPLLGRAVRRLGM